MHASTFLANTAISVLLLGAAGVVVSLQVTNPLLTSDVTAPALATVGVLVAAVLLAIVAGAGTQHRETTYW